MYGGLVYSMTTYNPSSGAGGGRRTGQLGGFTMPFSTFVIIVAALGGGWSAVIVGKTATAWANGTRNLPARVGLAGVAAHGLIVVTFRIWIIH